MVEKIPPQDIEAEQSLLGALMLSKEAVAQVATIIKANYFYREAHGKIYEKIIELFQKNLPVDIITISDALKKDNALEIVGGRSYIAELLDSVPSAANANKYAEIIQEKAFLRKLINTAGEIMEQGYDNSFEADQIIEFAQKSVIELSKERTSDQFVLLKDILMPVIDDIHKIYDNENQIRGVPSGFKDLDTLLSGFNPSDLIILAARPAMGKTTLALNFAMNAAIYNNMGVAIYSIEMPKEQLAMRMLCSEAKINSARMRTANMLEHEYKNLTHALGRLGDAPIYIEDSPHLTPLKLQAKTRRLQNEADIKLVIIDYLQLMKSGNKKPEGRFQEISEIVREVKAVARDLNLPIIALSQLSREVEKRQDTVPKLSDLRETGEIEQTADIVMFIHRPDYYEHSVESTSLTKLYIEKHRHGATGSVDLMFKKDISRFYASEQVNVQAE